MTDRDTTTANETATEKVGTETGIGIEETVTDMRTIRGGTHIDMRGTGETTDALAHVLATEETANTNANTMQPRSQRSKKPGNRLPPKLPP